VDPRGVFEAPGAQWAEADIGAAAAALRQLAGDPAMAMAIGEAGRCAAVRQFGTAGLARAVMALGLPVAMQRAA
jgi:hypothetical protein